MAKEKNDWSDLEIHAAVDAYLHMLDRQLNNDKINKAHENRVLRQRFLTSRTKGSVEFRMQNISAVLEELDRPWLKGYVPAKNSGTYVKEVIRKALDQHDISNLDKFSPTADEGLLEQRANALEKIQIAKQPKGILKPKLSSSVGKSYVRDPEVRAWVRQQAGGICEGCDQNAPFEIDGKPFLEVHHVKHLAQNGSDRITNAVALCPNCHRRCHHSSDREEFTLSLYEKVKRLSREDV